MDRHELSRRKKKAALRYLNAGADLVIDSIQELPQVIQTLNHRMAKGEAL